MIFHARRDVKAKCKKLRNQIHTNRVTNLFHNDEFVQHL